MHQLMSLEEHSTPNVGRDAGLRRWFTPDQGVNLAQVIVGGAAAKADSSHLSPAKAGLNL